MVVYIAQRLLQLLVVLLGVSVIVFVLNRVIPGNPAELLLGPYATPHAVSQLEAAMGLNKPIFNQYLVWLRGVLRGDFGTSIQYQQPVLQLILERFPATVELTLASLCFALSGGIVAGAVSAVRHNSLWDAATTVASTLLMSLPVFWLGLMLTLIFSLDLHLFPFGGQLSVGISLHRVTGFDLLDSVLTGNLKAFGNALWHLILPAIALASFPLAAIARATRANMLDVIGQEYITTARAKGLARFAVYGRHALKNALIPIITVAGLYLGSQLAGAILVEVVFAWPGIGRLGYAAIEARDYPVVQGFILFVTLIFALVNIVVDVLYAVVDPRVQYD